MNLSEITYPVITIGRSFGAGGREVGQALATALGYDYYDKQLLEDAARQAGLNTEIFHKNDERAPGFLSGLMPMSMGYSAHAWYTGPSAATGEGVYQAQCEFMRAVAAKGPCVIVGRTADYVLRDIPGLVSVFLHAPEDACIERIMRRAQPGTTPEQARTTLRRINKCRSEFYNFYTDRTWGDASSYDICIDSSKLSTDKIVQLIRLAIGI